MGSKTQQPVAPEAFASFGALLRFLRVRARLSQRDLAIAAGYSEAHISRLEQNQRRPDRDVIIARMLPALALAFDSPWAAQLLALAADAPPEPAPPREPAPPDRTDILHHAYRSH